MTFRIKHGLVLLAPLAFIACTGETTQQNSNMKETSTASLPSLDFEKITLDNGLLVYQYGEPECHRP